MENQQPQSQPEPRPWFRLSSLARPIQPVGPPPAPTPQPPAALLPRPTMFRPTFRPPIAAQPQPAVIAPLRPPRPRVPPPQPPPVTTSAPPLQTPRPRAPPPQLPPVTTSAPPLPPPRAVVSPMSPPFPVTQKSPLSSPAIQNFPPTSPVDQISPHATPVSSNSPHASPISRNSLASPFARKSPSPASPDTRISPSPASPDTRKSPYLSPGTQKSPLPSEAVIRKSPPSSPVTQNAPASSLAYKSPRLSPVAQKYRASPDSSTTPSPTLLPSSAKPEIKSPLPSNPSSPSLEQEVARSLANSSAVLSSPGKHKVSPIGPTSPRPSNGFLNVDSGPPLPSPKTKPALRSPPSFSLPPSQVKFDGEYEKDIPAVAEQKIVRHVQDTVGNHDKASVGAIVKPKEREIKKASNSEDKGMRVISISGENRGAVMELGYPARTQGISQNYKSSQQKLRSDGELLGGDSLENERRSKMKASNHTARPIRAYMNNNVQGINSSIVLDSTLSHHNPGIHISRSIAKGHPKGHDNEQKLFRKEEQQASD